MTAEDKEQDANRQPDQRPRKGLFSRRARAKDIDLLKAKINPSTKESPRTSFEAQAYQEQEAPTPQPEEEAIQPPSPTRKETPTLDDLEDRLKKVTSTLQQPRKAVTLTLASGKHARTPTDLKQALHEMTPGEFEQRQGDGELSTWARLHLFDPVLAGEIGQARTKQEAIKAVNDALQPRLPQTATTTKAVQAADEAHDHFTRLQADHAESMKALHDAATHDKPGEEVKELLKKAFQLPDGKSPQTVHDLLKAVDLLEDDTYEQIVTRDKDAFKEYLRELASTTARLRELNPQKVHADLAADAKAYIKQLDDTVADIKRDLEAAEERIKHEVTASEKAAEAVMDAKRAFEEEERRAEEQRAQWAQELEEREATLEKQRAELQALAEQHQQKQEELERQRENLRKEREAKEQALAERERKAREQELASAEKAKKTTQESQERQERLDQEELRLQQRAKKLDEREAKLEQEHQAKEQRMQDRERAVQEAVNRILAIDEDIKNQRQKLEKERKELEQDGFKTYLSRALKDVEKGHLPLSQTAEEQASHQKHAELHSRIDECNQAIENKDFPKAKELYHELKDKYEQEQLGKEERDILYDSIQELYANLHLAMMERQG
ncbi:MAG: hypothetical protein ACLFO2_01000 [Candidatus Woesearchaeota archaeon]